LHLPAGYRLPAQTFGAQRPPRPPIPVAASLLLAGGVLMIVGTIVPWLTRGDASINGFDEYLSINYENNFDLQAPGAMFVFFAVVMIAFAIASFAARKVLALMIIGIVVGAFSILAAAAELAHYNDTRDWFVAADLGVGLPLVLLGGVTGTAGAIAGCAKRRR
jgi:hypothetical protein